MKTPPLLADPEFHDRYGDHSEGRVREYDIRRPKSSVASSTRPGIVMTKRPQSAGTSLGGRRGRGRSKDEPRGRKKHKGRRKG